jgi:protein O-mannosyl-transferase
VLLFVCALLSKSVTASLPAVVLLVIWWKRGRITLEDLKPLALLFGLGLAMSYVTGWIEQYVIGAQGKPWDYAPTLAGEIAARCLIAGRAVWFYATKLYFPAPLVFNYPRWNVSPAVAWQYLFPLAVLGVIGALWALRHRIGRGPIVCVLFFVGSLVPALGFVNVFPMQY